MGVSPPAPKKTENISKSTVGRCSQFCRSGFLLRQGKARREYCCIVKGFNAAWAKICPSNRVKCGACAKMQNRTASRAGLKIGHARFCTYLCADISGGCAVLTKFLTQLNGRGGFHRRVFECAACRLKQKCMFCRPKSQQNASRFSSCSVILHSAHTKTCKKNRAFVRCIEPKRIMKPCIMQTAKCLQKQFCKFSKCGCKTRKTVQHAQKAKLVFVENS